MGSRTSRVTILDGHQLFTEIVGLALDREGYRCRTVLAGTATSPADLVRRVTHSRPDAVVASLDLRSGYGDGGTVLRSLAAAGLRVLALTESVDPAREGEALFLGAHGVVARTASLDAFVVAIHDTVTGVAPADGTVHARLADTYRDGSVTDRGDGVRLASLSRLERETLNHLAAGRVVHEIAILRVVSEHTVRTQVKAILGKLEVSSQGRAVALARQHSWDVRNPIQHDAPHDAPHDARRWAERADCA